MASFTDNYWMAYFDAGDKLDDQINVELETDRFVFIDKQLYGLYSVFGDGVISGWEVSDHSLDRDHKASDGLSVSVSSGSGIIGHVTCITPLPSYIILLSPNSSFYVCATSTQNSPSDQRTKFVVIPKSQVSFDSIIKLALVTTGDNGILSIDNTIRDYLNFEQQIEDAINAHKHRGMPSKIDLQAEVKNQLSGARIQNCDMSKFTSGRFDTKRMPIINHNDLTGTGILTHAELDTIYQGLSSTDNIGTVALINHLKQTVFEKHINSDADKYSVNQISVLPTENNELIDYANTTAVIDYDAKVFSGLHISGAISFVYTNNFVLPGKITKGVLTSKNSIPANGSITFGITSNGGTDFSTYSVVTPDQMFSLTEGNSSLRVGVKMITPVNLYPYDPDAKNFNDFVIFEFENQSLSTQTFNFRLRFYNDIGRTNLYAAKFSSDSQIGWVINDFAQIPAIGYEVAPNEMIKVSFYANDNDFVTGKTYYMILDVWDGSSFSGEVSDITFTSSGDNSPNKYIGLPMVYDFSLIFEMDNGMTINLNNVN